MIEVKTCGRCQLKFPRYGVEFKSGKRREIRCRACREKIKRDDDLKELRKVESSRAREEERERLIREGAGLLSTPRLTCQTCGMQAPSREFRRKNGGAHQNCARCRVLARIKVRDREIQKIMDEREAERRKGMSLSQRIAERCGA